MKIKKLLSLVLAMIMVISMLPTTVLAADAKPATIGTVGYDTLADAIAAANTGDTIILANGTHTMPNSVTNKSITIKGGKKAVVEMLTAVNATGSTINFNGVTAKFDNDGYEGLQHATKVTYTNCTLIGTQFLYAPVVTFTDCTFEMYDTATEYAIWTYGAKNVTFTHCTFNTNGKAILVYTEGAHQATVQLIDCNFYGNGTFNDKAAVEVGQSAYGNKADYKLSFENCTAQGFVTNHSTSNLWGNKNDMAFEDMKVAIDGVTVNVPNNQTHVVAAIGDDLYASLAAAILAAQAGDTVELLANITVTDPIEINKSLTLDLGAFTITGEISTTEIINGETVGDGVLRIYSAVVDTVIDVTIEATTGGITNTGIGYAIFAGEDIDGGTDAERTNLTINGGNYVSNGKDCIKQIVGLCTVNDGTYKSTYPRTVLNGLRYYNSEFKINGGSFYGFNPSCVSIWTGGNNGTLYHHHDIIAAGKTAAYADGWYTVVDGTYTPIVETKSLCFGSVGAAINAIVGMNDVANLGVITLLGSDTLSVADALLAIEYDFSFILDEFTLGLPTGYSLDDVTLEDGRAAKKINAPVVAKIGDVQYYSLQSAIEAAKADETITLLENCTIDMGGATITLADGVTLDLNGKTLTVPYQQTLFAGENITIKNGTITTGGLNQYGLYIMSGSFTLEDLVCTNGVNVQGGTVTMENCTVTNPNNKYYAVYSEGNVTILSGTFKNTSRTHSTLYGNITVYGGTFSKDPSAFVAEGYVAVEDNGGYTVQQEYVAAIGENQYFTLQAAIEAAQAGDTITVLKNITERNVTVAAGKRVIIDLNGKTVDVDIMNYGVLTVKNGTINNTNEEASAIENNGAEAELTVENLNITSVRHALRIDGGKATIVSGTYVTIGQATVFAVNISTGATVEIVDGTFKGAKETGTNEATAAVKVRGNSTVTIANGNFSGGILGTLQCDETSTISITGGIFDEDPTAYVAEGYAALNIVGQWTVAEVAERELIVTADKNYYVTGETVTVTVKLNGTGIVSAEWTLVYNEELFELVSGQLSGKVFEDSGIDNGTILATYTFLVKEQTKDGLAGEFTLTDALAQTRQEAAAGYEVETNIESAFVTVDREYVIEIGEKSFLRTGEQIILVYTNNKAISFTYNGMTMYDVTALYAKDGYAKAFAIIVLAPDAANVAAVNRTVGAAYVLTMSDDVYDVNRNGKFDLGDATTVNGVYNVNEFYFDFMALMFYADVDGDMDVDHEDFADIIAAYYAN